MNIMLGSRNAGIESESRVTKYLAVPKSFITELNDQASNNISPVIINPFIPSIQTSIASVIVNIFFNTPITIATIDANTADCKSAVDASAALNACWIAVNENGDSIKIFLIASSLPAIIEEYPL